MKKLRNLKLNYLAKSELDSQEMNLLVGGDEADNCCCSCWAYGKGGSSTGQNNSANTSEGKKSIYGCEGDKEEEKYVLLMSTGFCGCD